LVRLGTYSSANSPRADPPVIVRDRRAGSLMSAPGVSGDGFKETIIAFVREHIALAEPLVFAMGFAEGVPVLSLLIPSTPLFLGIGAAHAAAGGQFWLLWLSAALGAWLSDIAMYLLARHYKYGILKFRIFSRHPDWWPRGHALFDRWGILAVLAGKFLGVMRPFIPAVAGIVEMPLNQFLPASLFASLAWGGIFLGAGHGLKWLVD
jgi:membrane protein DedA with SNARE-associated domain